MSCCGSNSAKNVRSQPVYKHSQPKTVAVQRVDGVANKTTIVKNLSSSSLPVRRQHRTPPKNCVKCGFPLMIVNTNSTQISQCSNANCRHILK
jgi:hypothetical protein